jgi:L-alanine-DL-glutamate epimerase-like enolase superfamily enzyme
MKMEATIKAPGGAEVRYAARSATQGDHVIRTIEAIPIRLPLTRPIKWAAGELQSIDNVIVIVTLANGVQGIADAPPRPSIYGETQASILAVVRDHLAPMLTGANAFDSWRLWNRMRSVAWNPCAKAALDMALHDAQAKSLGISCAELMGGTVRPLQVNWRLALGSVEVMLADADEKMQAHGFSAFKVKCGIDARKDIAMLTALRRHVGPEVELTVDMNQGYDLQTLIDTGPALAELGVALIEEPINARNDAGKKLAADRLRLPLSGDDSCVTLDDVRDQLTLGAIRAVVIKCARSGYTESRDILGLTRAFHVPTHIGTQADMQIGCAAGGHFACTFDSHHAHEISTYLDAADQVVTGALEIRDGKLILPPGPGIGFELDAGKLKSFRIDH